jgi:carboxypeptidase family protein/TonB-dependent receptor-like protein
MRFLTCVFAIFLMMSGSIRGQSPNATLNGQVLDSSGGVIAAAIIDVVNTATNVRYSTKTNAEGMYVLPELPPANYEIQVSHSGFKTIVKPDVLMNVRDAVVINFTLPIGAISERVTVEAGASMINTTDGSVSTVVDQTYVRNMPLNGRSFQDLILLTPGTVAQSPQSTAATGARGLGNSGELSVNGQRTESNYYTVDGVSANVGTSPGVNAVSGAGVSGSIASSTALGTTQALVSVDSLQEFRVQSSSYSAEYGRNPGGQFAFETKSGTNQWHGTTYDYLRNDYLDATDWFNDYFGKPKTALRQNDFGGTLGGPVKIPGVYSGNDKTFFLVSYEGLRLIAPQAAAVIPVPDATLRANTLAPLNQVLNAFPVQSPSGIDNTASGVAQFIGSWSNPSSIDSTSVRFDHAVSDKLRLFFRFSDTNSSSEARGLSQTLMAPTMHRSLAYTLRTYTAGATSALSNRLSNEFRLNYSSNDVTSRVDIDAFGGSTPVSLPQLTGGGAQTTILFFLGGPLIGLGDLQRAVGAQKQWNLVDTVSLSLGRHQLKFGADHRRLAPLAAQPTPSPLYLYFGANAVKSNSGSLGVTSFAPAYPLYKNFSAFVQDEWKVSQRLSLSMGLRWDVNPAPGAAKGLKAYTIQGAGPATWTLAPQGTPLWQTTWYNFAPRLGLAYVLRNRSGWETVSRAAVGVFFDTGQQLGTAGFGGPGFKAQVSSLPASFGNVAGLAPPVLNPPTGKFGIVFGFSPHLQLPYTLQWNASIEQGLGRSQSLRVSYVAAHGSRLLQQNLFSSSTSIVASQFLIGQNGLTSDYDSLQAQFQRRFSQGLTALASYTFSHCIDYSSSNFNIGYVRGNCDFDVRHNLSAAFSYDLPKVGHSGFANAVLHHWGLDDRFIARTGFPVDVNGGTFFDPVTFLQMTTPADLIAGQPVYLYGSACDSKLQALGNLKPGRTCPGGRAINPCAFIVHGTAPGAPCFTGGTVPAIVGLTPRNFLTGFGAWQMNLAVRREFPIYENLKLQFRAEAFNVFNHPNFGNISTSIGATTFGQATSTLASSLGGVLNPLYQTGGSRSMQFALKLLF